MNRAWSSIVAGFLIIAAGQGAAQVVCLPIDRIEVTGVTLFAAKERGLWTKEFEGRCLGLPEFDALIQRVTLAYVDQGFILSRAYLPEQDLSDGSLTVTVVEGQLSEITVNGKVDPRWMGMIFPGQIGKPVNIRPIEQGLDQIKTMPRWQASMEFEPAADAGGSVLAVTAAAKKPWELKFTSNNRGTEQSGLWTSGVSGDVTNLAGLNDTLSFGVTHSLSPGPFSFGYAGDRNRSSNLSWKLPYGRHLVTASFNMSDYTLTIPGAISPIPTSGVTRVLALQSKSLLHRDQKTKTHLTLDLTRTQTQNYIFDVMIGASSRVITSLKATLSHERPLAGGDLSLSLWGEAGLSWFGAEQSARAQYLLFGTTASYERKFDTSAGAITWNSTLNAQGSGSDLYPSQMYSMGGASSVRGTRVALATGTSGENWRNEVSFAPKDANLGALGAPSVYAGLDLGWARGGLSGATSHAAGAVVGIKVQGEHSEFDLSWQEVVATSPGLQRPKGEAIMSFVLKY